MSRREADFGPDFEPYLRNLEKKWNGQKMILIASSSMLVLIVAFLVFYPVKAFMIMAGLAALMTLGTLYMLNGYRLLTHPKKHHIKKRFKTKDLEKLARTKLRIWAEDNEMLIRREAGVYYLYFWYAHFYTPIYFVIKLEQNTRVVYVYYLWSKQYFVVSPDHPNISHPLSPYRVRKRDLERDRNVLDELEAMLG